MSPPDREAFLRRLEGEQQQQPELEEVALAADTTNKAQEQPEGGGSSDEETLRYLSVQCGLTDMSLESIDASSLDLLRQLTPKHGSGFGSGAGAVLQHDRPPRTPRCCPATDDDDGPDDEPRCTDAARRTDDDDDDEERVHELVTLRPEGWQGDLIDAMERQTRLVESTQRRVDALERQLAELLARDDPHHDPPRPSRTERGRALLQAYVDRLHRIRTVRALRFAYQEGRRQNIHANLNVGLLFKMLFFVAFFGGAGRGGSTDDAGYGFHRSHVLGTVLVFVYLLQAGVVAFLYRFLTVDLKRLEDEHDQHDHNNVDNDDTDRPPRRMQHERDRDPHPLPHVVGAAPPLLRPPPQVPAAAPPPPQRTNITDGVIAADGGFLHDLGYVLASFFLSLIPTWKPVPVPVVEEETPPPVTATTTEDATDNHGSDEAATPAGEEENNNDNNNNVPP